MACASCVLPRTTEELIRVVRHLALEHHIDRFEHFFNLLVQVAGRALEEETEDSSTAGYLHARGISGEDIKRWGASDVGEWLEAIGFPEYMEVFRVNRIDGKRLLYMPRDHLPKLRVQQWEHINLIMNEIGKLRIKVDSSNEAPWMQPDIDSPCVV